MYIPNVVLALHKVHEVCTDGQEHLYHVFCLVVCLCTMCLHI